MYKVTIISDLHGTILERLDAEDALSNKELNKMTEPFSFGTPEVPLRNSEMQIPFRR